MTRTPWRPIKDDDDRNRRNKLTVGLIICNAIFCLIAGACWVLEVQSKIHQWAYIAFYIGEAFIAFIYVVNAGYRRDLARMVGETFGSQARTRNADPLESVYGLSFPLAVIGAINAALLGFLTYYTGGPSNSPYAQVLVAVLLISEQTHTVKDGNHGNRFRTMIRICIREFGLFFVLTIAFYTALWFFQWQFPVHVSTAPAEVTVLITLIIFLVGSVTTYLSNTSR